MLANSLAMHMLVEGWAIFGDVGKQLGSLRLCWQTVRQTLVCTDSGNLINAFESSAYGEEQNDSDFPVFVFFENYAFVSSAFLHRVTKRQSCLSIFSGWCRMQDLKRPFMAVL